jgi:hypothetical protein
VSRLIPADCPEGSIGYELAEMERRVRALPWWQLLYKRALLRHIEASRNTIAFCRDAFIYDYIRTLRCEIEEGSRDPSA